MAEAKMPGNDIFYVRMFEVKKKESKESRLKRIAENIFYSYYGLSYIAAIVLVIFLLNVPTCTLVSYCSNSKGHRGSLKPDNSSYTGGVVEHYVTEPKACVAKVCSKHEAWSYLFQNLQAYRRHAKNAKSKGVDILVFPEDGLTGFEFRDKNFLRPFLQYVPDDFVDRNPCLDTSSTWAESPSIVFLSCLARELGMYLVFNTASVTAAGRIYNTDVALDRRGAVLAVYHKFNLFERTEAAIYDQPDLEVVSFHTEFGEVGIITCFDALFKRPLIDLVVERGIKNIVLLTGWWNSPPFLTALGYHSSLAAGLGINFLAANRHFPFKNETGSGIYTTEGPLATFKSHTTSLAGQLVTASVPVNPTERNISWSLLAHQVSPSVPEVTIWNETVLFFDLFKTVDVIQHVRDEVGQAEDVQRTKICMYDLCCIAEVDGGLEVAFKLGVYDGVHTVGGTYALQICFVEVLSFKNVSKSTSNPKISIMGTFLGDYVYPQALDHQENVQQVEIVEDGQASVPLRDDGVDGAKILALLSRNYDKDFIF